MSLSFTIFIITSMCSKYTMPEKSDCLLYMNNCTFNESIIGTFDVKLNSTVTLESNFDNCRGWWYEQR